MEKYVLYFYLMKKQFPLILFLVLVAVLVAVFYWNGGKKLTGQDAGTETQKTDASANNSASNPLLPLSVDSKAVTGALVHYFVSGKIKEIKEANEGKQLVLDSEEKNLPMLVIGDKTRISKITPPYSENTSKFIKIDELKPGMVVDLSIEYDLRSKMWSLQDVFVPADRNPQ